VAVALLAVSLELAVRLTAEGVREALLAAVFLLRALLRLVKMAGLDFPIRDLDLQERERLAWLGSPAL
jgi:hypothetical protein